MGLTREIGAFLAGMRGTVPPEGAAEVIRAGFTDLMAVAVAGWDEGAPRGLRGALLGRPEAGWAALLDGRVPPADAALLLGTAGHVLDFDDTGLDGHPSAVLVPAILAEAAASGADGAAMARAYLAGYEVWAELVEREPDAYHRKGWHPSAVIGPVAAAAACAVLRGLDEAAATRAVGLAASMAGGVVANFGTMAKPFQLGRAAQSGVQAARLAEAGLTAAPDALEHRLGLLRALSPAGRVDTARPARLGRSWRILARGLNVKLYPVCYAAHRVLDAMHDLVLGNDIRPEEIAGVEVAIGEAQADMLREHAPETPAEARFSAEFAVACMALARRCGPSELEPGFLARPDLRVLFPKVRIATRPGANPDEPTLAPADEVRVRLRDGRVLESGPVALPRGHFRNPAGPEALRRKFEACTVPRLGAAEAARLFARLQSVEALPGVAALLPPTALRGAA